MLVVTTLICGSCEDSESQTSLEEAYPELKDVPVYQPNALVAITIDVENNASFEECFFFNPGETIIISFMVANNSALTTADRIVFHVSGPGGETEDIEVGVAIEPEETIATDFIYQTTVSSALGRYDVYGDLYGGGKWLSSTRWPSFLLGLDLADISVYDVHLVLKDPDWNTAKEETMTVTAFPSQSQTVSFEYDDLSSEGLWIYKFEIIGYSGHSRSRAGSFAITTNPAILELISN
jgi:hypothetical protein